MTNAPHPDALYVFLHIPKTAGSTFRYHLEHNFPSRTLLPVYLGGGGYTHLRTGTHDYFDSREDVDAYLGSLSQEERDTLRVVYGHDVYYGIHRFFSRPVRYVTFVREPAAQKVSLYNFYRAALEDAPPYPYDEVDVRRQRFLHETYRDLHEGSTALSFPRWLRERGWHKNYTTSFLEQRNFKQPGEPMSETLRRFYFIGRTEHFDTDALFLYRILGVRHLFARQNVSRMYAHLSDMPIDAMLEQSQEDVALYREACGVSQRRRRHHIAYDMAIVYIRWAVASGPRLANRALAYGYRLSAWWRRKSRLYSAALDWGKSLLWKK